MNRRFTILIAAAMVLGIAAGLVSHGVLSDAQVAGLTQILGPLVVDTLVWMGDERERTVQSLAAAMELRS